MADIQIIQKIILLATGAPGATAVRQQLINLFEETGDFSLIADLIDSFLNQLTAESPKGIVGIIQAIANNGFSLNLSDQEAQQLAQDFANQGIDSWSKLFSFILTDVDGDLGSLLNNRAQAANRFTDLLTELNKENDYNGSQAINVAKEWIAGINASSTSFELANNTVQELINRFFNGNVLGKVVDGNIANATVFIDENGDGILNPGERSTTTDSQGTFLFQGELPEGRIISIGGTDTSTGLPVNAVLSAPLGSTFISPLTSLTNLIISRGLAASPAEAEQFLYDNLALAPADLSTFDPITLGLNSASSLADQQTALNLQASTAQIIILINVFTVLINSIDNPGSSETTLAVLNGFVDALLEAQENEIILDLTKPVVLANVITDATVAITPGDENEVRSIVKPLALVLADLNSRIQAALTGNDIQAAFAEIAKIQAFSQLILGATVNTLVETGDTLTLVTDFTGNNLTVQLDNFNLPSVLIDTDAPTLAGSKPVDDQLQVSVSSDITLFFNEDIQLGTGTIIISNRANDTRTIDITDSSQVILNGQTLIVDPTQDLVGNTLYFIQIDSSAIKDIAGNNFAGIADNKTLNFTTDFAINPVDITPPDLSDTFPINMSNGQAVNSNIVLDFNEIVVANTGNIIISNGSNDVRIISINDTSQVSFSTANSSSRVGASGTIITIDPTQNLIDGSNYFVQIPSGVITDVAGNDFTGLSDTQSFSFTTAALAPPVITQPPVVVPLVPLLINTTPLDNAQVIPTTSPITLTFNKAVMAGAGNIILSGGIDTRTISINDTSQVTINGNTVTITPNSKLVVSTLYNVQLVNGVITDTGGASFAGILNPNTLNFQTDGMLDLTDVTPAASTTGFVINGISGFDQSGFSVSNAGDVNGDGLDDLIVGAYRDDPNGNSSSGASFVVFGKTDNLPVELSTVEAGAGGFVINGSSTNDRSGISVSDAGDVNGDGIADLLVGASGDDNNNAASSGSSFVIFGKSNGSAIELSALDQISNNSGFVINGASSGDQSGRSVSSAGDVNGDGLDDLIVGAYRDSPNGGSSGASFVVFGKADDSPVDLSIVEQSFSNNGFVINGVTLGDKSGTSVSSAGDVNGDGLDDLIIGAPSVDTNGLNTGASYVVFGKIDGVGIDLSAISQGANNSGFVINGIMGNDYSGYSVSGGSDVNGDGLADLLIGQSDGGEGYSYTGEIGKSFVVFGKADGAVVELSTVAQNNNSGFVINGVSPYDYTGHSISSAGDVNGDGLTDIIVGAFRDDPNGNGNSGESFVVFGKANGIAFELSNAERGIGGFAINGVSSNDNSGISVSAAGDVNGDGFDDLIVGANRYDTSPTAIDSGASYVVFGGQGTTATLGGIGNDMLIGSGIGIADQLVAGRGDDTLIGNGGADVLRGGAGNDILAISDLSFASIDGGTGNDTLRFDSGLSLDFTNSPDLKINSIETINLLTDSSNNTVTLNITDVFSLSETQSAFNTLTINGSMSDTVILVDANGGQSGNWAISGQSTGGTFEYSVGGRGVIGTVFIDLGVNVMIV